MNCWYSLETPHGGSSNAYASRACLILVQLSTQVFIFIIVQNMDCGQSLGPPYRGSSNEHASSFCLMIVSYRCQNHGLRIWLSNHRMETV